MNQKNNTKYKTYLAGSLFITTSDLITFGIMTYMAYREVKCLRRLTYFTDDEKEQLLGN